MAFTLGVRFFKVVDHTLVNVDHEHTPESKRELKPIPMSNTASD